MQVAKYFCDRCKKEIPSVMDVEHGKLKIPSAEYFFPRPYYELCHDCYSEFNEAERKAQNAYRKVINDWLRKGGGAKE